MLDAKVVDGVVVLELELRSRISTLRATDTFRAVRFAGGLGLERQLRVARPAVEGEATPIIELVAAPAAVRAGIEPDWPARTVEHRGAATASEPGHTYALTLAMCPGGRPVWSYRAGLHGEDQAQHPARDVEWTEVLLPLESASVETGDDRIGAALIQALVDDPYDRRAFVRAWSAAQHRLLYELPVERVLDPALGSVRGSGIVGDPWPALAQCDERSLATLLAPGSRLVLLGGDHGVYHTTHAVLVGAAGVDEAPAVLKGLDAPRAEAFDPGRARVTLRLADAVTVELWGDPLVARYVETSSGRFATDWEAIREVDLSGRSGEHSLARTSELRLSRDEAEIGLTWKLQAHGPRSGTDGLRAVEVAGTWGLVRRIVVARDHLEGLDSIVIAPEPSSPLGRPNDSSSPYEQVLCERGRYWDVCRFAVTYVVLKRGCADGATQWWIRYGQLPFDQATDCGNAIDLVEAVFLAGRDAKLDLGELLAAVVENNVDRRTLLRTHALAVYERRYGNDDD